MLVVEDVSTTGGSPLTAAEALQEAGAEVIAVAVIVDRGARAAVEAAGFEYRAAFEPRRPRPRLTRRLITVSRRGVQDADDQAT